jgi:hypothetical protein
MFEKLQLINPHPSTESIYVGDIPAEIFSEIQTKVSKLQKNFFAVSKLTSMNKSLVGQIENSVRMTPLPSLESFLKNFFKENISTKDIEIHSNWVNFQKKTEYNPNHTHTGDWAYVIWVKIPFSFNEEDIAPNSIHSSTKTNGRFELSYINENLEVTSKKLEVDSKFEGKFILFRSNTRHCVYPFYTSDDYRISMAGNIIFV